MSVLSMLYGNETLIMKWKESKEFRPELVGNPTAPTPSPTDLVLLVLYLDNVSL
jgi:hypothetical protein